MVLPPTAVAAALAAAAAVVLPPAAVAVVPAVAAGVVLPLAAAMPARAWQLLIMLNHKQMQWVQYPQLQQMQQMVWARAQQERRMNRMPTAAAMQAALARAPAAAVAVV
jgi:hypothetical protein